MKQVLSQNYAMVLAQADAFEINHPSTIFTNDNVEVIIGLDLADAESKLVKASTLVTSIPVLPDVGQWVEKDKLYGLEGKIYKCIQGHIRTVYSPSETLALFNVYRIEAVDLVWIEGEKVVIGIERIYNSKKYKCLQGHVTQGTWNPELTLGTLWQLVVSTPEWTIGVAYKVNDIVTYQGKTYKCLQAHTSIATWNPVAAGSLWKVQ